jgi:hypothetical protein
MGLLMRRRLRKFLPIVLIALAVQSFAPIAACWAATVAASDPLRGPAICHDDGAANSGQSDQSGQPRAHDGCCSTCNLAHAGAPVDTPQATIETPYLQLGRVVWRDVAADRLPSRTGSHAQARAPPHLT